jgi:hypothetical protein
MIWRWLLPAVLLASACGATAAKGPASDGAIVAFTAPEAQFRTILSALIFKTQSMSLAGYSLGIERRCAVVRPVFEAAIKQNLPAWRANLINAYRENVPEATLASALAGGSADRQALRAYIGKIGAQMQGASTPILQKAVGEVLKPVVDAAMLIDRNTVDGAARVRELKAATPDSLYCGLTSAGRETL